MGLVKLVMRILALIGKEITEVFRRPGAVLSLVLGPFIILAVFGFGYQGIRRDLAAIVVVNPSSGLPQDAASYQELGVRGIAITEVVTDRAAAVEKLRADLVDIVIVPPADPYAEIEAGRQADLLVITNVTDPVAANYAGFLAETMASSINREIYRLGAEEGQAYALRLGGRDLSNVPPEAAEAFRSAFAKGVHFNRHIRDRYRHTELVD